MHITKKDRKKVAILDYYHDVPYMVNIIVISYYILSSTIIYVVGIKDGDYPISSFGNKIHFSDEDVIRY